MAGNLTTARRGQLRPVTESGSVQDRKQQGMIGVPPKARV